MAMETKSGRESFESFEAMKAANKVPQTIELVLRDKKLKQKFETFLIDRVAIESLQFLDSVAFYEKVEKPEWRVRAAGSIIAKFVSPNAQYQINISERVREHLLNLVEFEKDSFEPAKNAVLALLQENFYLQFVAYLEDPSTNTMEPIENVQEYYPKEAYLIKKAASRKTRSSVNRILTRNEETQEI
mmetsp:Transcript_14080/g.16035  ORF Transcript_14080/g.16035 Transcript_14080/m.16035 type:complete len:187 (+) Transcript_14080:242-802(+)